MRFKPRFLQYDDDNHCVQACVLMVLTTLGFEISKDEVDQLTDYDDKLYTWVPRTVIELSKKVPGTKLWSDFDYKVFAEKGKPYFLAYNSNDPKWAELQVQKASIGMEKEQLASKELSKLNLQEYKNPTINDFVNLLRSNLIISFIDTGYSSHAVLLYSCTGGYLFGHDPGHALSNEIKIPIGEFMKKFKNTAIVIPHNNISFGCEIGRNEPCPCGSGKKYKKCHG